MDIPSTSDLEPKSFADLSIFDGIGNNFKKHLDAHLAQANLDDKTDSLFMESVVIHNEINLEDELVKAKDEDEGAFRLLSMSFYDKKTRNSSSKTHAKSPPRTEEPNKVFTLRPNKPRSPKSPSAPGKTGSQPSITPFASEINANQIKDNRLGSPKMSVKPEIKLFSIKERVGKLNMSPQLSPVPQMSFTTAASPLEKSKSQTIPKEGAKQERERERDREKEGVRPQKPTSPLRESISRESSAEKKLNTLDLKISTMIKSKSPTNGVKSSSKERIFASPPRVTFSVSPKGFKFHSKLEGSVEKVKMTREPSEPNEKKLSISTKNEKSEKGERGEKEESPARNLSPKTFSLNKNILARRFDLQRVSLNNVNYTLAKESQVKESRTPSKTIQKTTSELANQQASQAQGQNLAQPVKIELAKGYRSNQSFYSKNASRRGSNNEQVKNSKLFGTKLRINTEENSSLKISVKDISDTSIQPQGSRSVKAKMIGLDFSSIRQREGVTFSSGKDVFEPPKLSLKSQKSKSKLKETIGRELDISKRKSSVLPLQCRTFDI